MELDEVRIGYPGSNGLLPEPVNCKLRQGDFICLIGRNGAGKSTLLRTMAGLIRPLSGSVKCLGHDIQSMDPSTRARRLSAVFWDRDPQANIRVFEMVSLGRYPHTGFAGRLHDEDVEIIRSSLRDADMEWAAGRWFHQLSDGERQRVLIARSLAQRTPVMILDEPTAFLDFEGRHDVMQLLGKISLSQNITVVISTHDLDRVIEMDADTLLMDKDGVIHAGPARELVQKGMFANLFKGIGFFFNRS
jgi:iron complex transport system ATP-binding protein